MATEDLTGTDKFVDDLVATNPVATDSVSDGDEHIRGVKNVLKNTLPNVTAAVTATAAQLNKTTSTFTGADGSSAGASGMVTAPVATDNTKFLKGDGTWATPAGGGGGSGGTITAVAAGAIANGDKVILKSDGKVATVASTTGISTPITAGSEVTFESYTLFGTAVVYNPNLADQIVVAYMDRSNSDYGTVRLGTITGTTPAFESEVVFNAASTSEWIHIAFDPNTTGKFVVVYEDVGDSNKLKAVVGSIASTTVTFGSEYTLDSTGAVSWPSCEFDPNTAGKFLVAYSDEGSSSYGRVIVSTINYTTGVITPGSPYTFKSSSTTYIGAAFDPNTAGKFVVGYESGNDGYTIVGTITTGTTVTFGSEVAFSTAAAWVVDVGVDFDPDTAGKFMVSYREDGPETGTDPLSKVLIGTVTGTVPSYGSSNSVWTGDTWGLVAEFIGSNKIIIAFRTDGPPVGQGVINLGTVSGTTVTMGTVQTFNAGNTGSLDIASDPNTSGKFITSYTDQGDNGYGKTVVGQLSTSTSTNLTADNFIGISDAAYADAATATIQVIGATDDAQSGMTIGSNYYVQTDGTLATTADSPSVSVGVALSATEILISGSSTLAELTDSTTATTDPLITSNLAVGHFWINSTSGEAYVCTDATTNANVWTNIGDGVDGVQPFTASGGTTTTYTSGGVSYKSHVFTSSGTFTASGSKDVDMLIVGGGGAGGAGYNAGGGGGGAGQVYKKSSVTFTTGTYSVTIGAGAAEPSDIYIAGSNGSDSSLGSTTVIGGGGGGAGFSASTDDGLDGGSGGGGGIGASFGGSAIAGATADYHGNDGASAPSSGWVSGVSQSGGGGGAGLAASAEDGGDGLVCTFVNGNNVYYGGGGAGGGDGMAVRGTPGLGGGGNGYSNGSANNTSSGGVNTGGGGGGGGHANDAGGDPVNGGSGIVIVRYAV